MAKKLKIMDYPKYKMVDGRRYGPTTNNRYYQPAYYHNPVETVHKKGKKAKQQEHEDKTHWILTKPQQFHVFKTGDENDIIDQRGIYSALNNCKEILGEDGQRLAIFETPRDENWHGYPIFSWEKPISEDIADKMVKAQMINIITKQKIIDGRI